MGNCIFKESGVIANEMVRVVTPTGGVMELYAPITVECVTNEFPGYALFGSPHRLSPPLLHTENLCAAHYYYLLPIHKTATTSASAEKKPMLPYRVSVDSQLSEAQVLPRYNSTGIWKVRLVIDTDQLSEILSQEARTEALIDTVRTAAKCAAAGAPSAVGSDRRSWMTATDTFN